MEETFSYIGGLPCLDFANAKNRMRSWSDAENFAAFLDWSLEAGTISERESALLRAEAKRAPRKAATALKRAADLSDLLCRVFSAVVEGDGPSTRDLDSLNAELASALGQAAVVAEGEGYEWGWRGKGSELNRALWPIVRSAVDLLVSDDLDQVKICANDGCRWVFLDTSRNHRRRWCEMKVCGNRAKVRRFRARTT